MIRNGHKFGVINFDRIPGCTLINATYRTVENVNVLTCISECRKNKACHSLNFHKKSESTTLCELNELDRYAADSELAFQKQAGSEYYEIKSACKGVICHNGARCASNHKEGTWQCRCTVNYAGKYCEKYNPYGGMVKFHGAGIINNELFQVEGEFNHATAKNVCKEFGAIQPSKEDIGRIASEAEYGHCSAAWNSAGGLGYPEYNGNCHGGSTHTGYFSHSCCSNKVTTLKNTWCLKKNIDFCKPGWYGNFKHCYLFRDDNLGTFEEAKNKCAAKNAVLAKVRITLPSIRSFIKRVCPDCRSMYVGAEK
ncbi:crumbs homolog 1-like, partial [Paramuricea clavata]